jgi:hypothetical protein
VSKRPTVALILYSAMINSPSIAAFTERLRELGWIEGRTVVIEYRWSDGRPESIAEMAAELVQQKVQVIVRYGAAVAALKQTTHIVAERGKFTSDIGCRQTCFDSTETAWQVRKPQCDASA